MWLTMRYVYKLETVLLSVALSSIFLDSSRYWSLQVTSSVDDCAYMIYEEEEEEEEEEKVAQNAKKDAEDKHWWLYMIYE